MGVDAREPSSTHGSPAWPVDRAISPTVLSRYCTCPREVRLRYIDQRTGRKEFSLQLTKGNVAHGILKHCADRIVRGLPPPGPPNFEDMASRRLHTWMFPSEETRRCEIADVVRWVHYGLECLDRNADYLLIERNATRSLVLPLYTGPNLLMARPDLILLHMEPDGEPFVEFIDYKTGKPRDDEVVPVFTRYVSRELLKRHLPNPTIARMQFTFLWLDARERQVIDLSLDYCEWAWESVKGQIEALLDEREWPERPSHLCNYCGYNGNACTAYARMRSGASPSPVLACDVNS